VSPIVYCAPLTFPVIAIVGLMRGGIYAWALPALVFGVVPLVEIWLRGADAGQSSVPNASRRWHRLVLYLSLPLVAGTTAVLIHQAGTDALVGLDWVGGVLSTGLVLGGLGINVAHELGHSRSRAERNAAKVLLSMSLYMHFFIEHNRGHHRNVGTEIDPASARRGEKLYAFWLRSITGGWMSAWWIAPGQMARLQAFQLSLIAGVIALAGWAAALSWIAAAGVGVLLLETVNYVEHYGLYRQRKENGRYERVQPIHSWNADHPVGRALLFELTRHADHHANTGRPYAALRHLGQAPQLPTGYPGMILAALIPSLFFRLMHPRLDAIAQRRAA
jgi:alkane 1-monooxygenase